MLMLRSPDDIVKGREALLTLQLPPELERTAREMAFGMKQKLLPLVNVSDRDQQTILQRKKVRVDRITSIAANSMRDAHRVCTLCAGIAHLYGGARINEWASSKRRSCICGGQWVIA